ncbi:hypothetical protein NRIC_05010 [Enterococcus florum]|uniref:Uncharacterized protein n=1 Tax=Enterococcus florum TaxID=2480627 RepID=A0A4P5P4N7_9ENTE|nr:hypothetical protein [Enterococcus florum]GCF92610.1 hypothetical protein NRIC_05010 [Enterococcus florum]
MEQLIAIVFIALLIYFVVKVGSFLWRIAGVLFLLFVLYTYKDQLITQFNSFLDTPNFGGLFQQIGNFFNGIWDWMMSFLF